MDHLIWGYVFAMAFVNYFIGFVEKYSFVMVKYNACNKLDPVI